MRKRKRNKPKQKDKCKKMGKNLPCRIKEGGGPARLRKISWSCGEAYVDGVTEGERKAGTCVEGGESA